MSIADKLTYLNETKRQLREAINAHREINNLPPIPPESPFRSYVDALNEVLINTGNAPE